MLTITWTVAAFFLLAAQYAFYRTVTARSLDVSTKIKKWHAYLLSIIGIIFFIIASNN